MNYILVTGSPCSNIGKGTAAAVLGRKLSRAGLRVSYLKVEPCLQAGLEVIDNRRIGEIVSGPGGSFDGDIARAAFWISGFEPSGGSDIALSTLLGRTLPGLHHGKVADARLEDALATALETALPSGDVVIVEVGGTVGEAEHGLVVEALRRASGRPTFHLHVAALVIGPGNRTTTKPVQLGLRMLRDPPDLVLARGALSPSALAPLRAAAGAPVVLVESLEWAELAFAKALLSPEAMLALEPLLTHEPVDTLLVEPLGSRLVVEVLHDGAGPEGYGSLVRRLLAWSAGHIVPRFIVDPSSLPSNAPVIRIGERRPLPLPKTHSGLRLEIVPVEGGHDARDASARPDWLGRADAPEGSVAAFIEALLEQASNPAPLAYSDPAFASTYLEASASGGLRDHAALDPLVSRALPAGQLLAASRILDLGCGDGRWAARLLAEGAQEVVGVEMSPTMAAAARARQLERFHLVQGSIENSPLCGSFDGALASLSLDHVAELGPVLARVASHLKPGARFVITTEHPLRTAPADGGRWHAEAAGRSARVRDYGSEGARRFRWFGRAEPVIVFHRSVETWMRLICQAGLDLIAVREPASDDPQDAGNPRFWLLVTELPGRKAPLVTIDGPAGSGKSTLGAALARRLGWRHVDSGGCSRTQIQKPDRRT